MFDDPDLEQEVEEILHPEKYEERPSVLEQLREKREESKSAEGCKIGIPKKGKEQEAAI